MGRGNGAKNLLQSSQRKTSKKKVNDDFIFDPVILNKVKELSRQQYSFQASEIATLTKKKDEEVSKNCIEMVKKEWLEVRFDLVHPVDNTVLKNFGQGQPLPVGERFYPKTSGLDSFTVEKKNILVHFIPRKKFRKL